MLDPKTLRIGNWLLLSNISKLPIQLIGIYDNVAYFYDLTGLVEEADISTLYPIPITYKTMKKMGFKLYEKNNSTLLYMLPRTKVYITAYEYNHKYLRIVKVETNKATLILNKGIDYVHQLQNSLKNCEFSLKIEDIPAE